MKNVITTLTILLCCISEAYAFNFHWELDETPEGSESATAVEPVQVILLDEVIDVPAHSASLALMRKYSVYLTPDWTPAYAFVYSKRLNPYRKNLITSTTRYHVSSRLCGSSATGTS